jgi:hypothetical protein
MLEPAGECILVELGGVYTGRACRGVYTGRAYRGVSTIIVNYPFSAALITADWFSKPTQAHANAETKSL